MTKHTIALIIVTILLGLCLFLFALVGVWIGWLTISEALWVSLVGAVTGLVVALMKERKAQKQKSKAQD
ncbi:MAG: hypothetical protein SPI72_07345 [Porphyromonas sp.]|nr:hypothetical protein [Porphyromonas sp.]